MIEHSDAYYDYKRNDPNAENPFTDPKDRARAERVVSGLVGKVTVDTQKYTEFVDAVTSKESNDYISFNSRCFEIQKDPDGIPVHRLLTAALGICAEGGEFTEVVKKMVFQGKPVNDENIFHMKRELGDIMWYVAQACMALDTDFNEIIEMNVEKLKARYPGGEFDVHYSENRKEGDL
jgi:NTP pyrophosphatase (non-canonical NTP hydrolase)